MAEWVSKVGREPPSCLRGREGISSVWGWKALLLRGGWGKTGLGVFYSSFTALEHAMLRAHGGMHLTSSEEGTTQPTMLNKLLTELQYRSVANKHRLSIQFGAKCAMCTVYVLYFNFQVSVHFAYHRCWLGTCSESRCPVVVR